ncbi:hypothetical protein [Actinoplanes sp. M2I2]|uniref:hypothetical protein n=1 Tax=Actinoplanes sp. M2I2 TaxID=1734444 RepID=UPI0020202572|nr:hypothetical protein [Actinoplanes sp. M2I2]
MNYYRVTTLRQCGDAIAGVRLTIREQVQRFVELGPLPSEEDNSEDGDADFDNLEQVLRGIERPVNQVEAAALSGSFGTDNCFGLAWTLLHLIETAPIPIPLTEPAADANPWIRRLWLRQQNALAASCLS